MSPIFSSSEVIRFSKTNLLSFANFNISFVRSRGFAPGMSIRINASEHSPRIVSIALECHSNVGGYSGEKISER